MLSGSRSAWRVVATAHGLSALLSVVAGFVPGDWFLSLHFQTFLYLVIFTMPDTVNLPFWVLGVLDCKRGLGLLLKALFLAVSSLRCRVRTPLAMLRLLVAVPAAALGLGVCAQQLWLTASVPHGTRNLLDQGSNLRPLSWHVDP